MIEFDFDTEEGRKATKEYIHSIIENDDKEKVSELLYAMLEFIVGHEIKFLNLKSI